MEDSPIGFDKWLSTEETFRFNQRKMNDAEQFVMALQSIVGKRLTYTNVTGKVISEATS